MALCVIIGPLPWLVLALKWPVVPVVKSTLGNSQRAKRKYTIVSAGTKSKSHQLGAQLGATKPMWIWRVVGHPYRLVFRPLVSSPSRSLHPQSPIAWTDKLNGSFVAGNFYQVLNSMM
eukprot:1161229-Pelagomonas_calceolata.AAC.11